MRFKGGTLAAFSIVLAVAVLASGTAYAWFVSENQVSIEAGAAEPSIGTSINYTCGYLKTNNTLAGKTSTENEKISWTGSTASAQSWYEGTTVHVVNMAPSEAAAARLKLDISTPVSMMYRISLTITGSDPGDFTYTIWGDGISSQDWDTDKWYIADSDASREVWIKWKMKDVRLIMEQETTFAFSVEYKQLNERADQGQIASQPTSDEASSRIVNRFSFENSWVETMDVDFTGTAGSGNSYTVSAVQKMDGKTYVTVGGMQYGILGGLQKITGGDVTGLKLTFGVDSGLITSGALTEKFFVYNNGAIESPTFDQNWSGTAGTWGIETLEGGGYRLSYAPSSNADILFVTTYPLAKWGETQELGYYSDYEKEADSDFTTDYVHYSLLTDITLIGSGRKINGTIEGNGNTMTASYAEGVKKSSTNRWININGTLIIQNCTINLDETTNKFVHYADTGLEFQRVEFHNIVITGSTTCGGGLMLQISKKGTYIFEDCVNKASITSSTQAGGLVKYIKTGTSATDNLDGSTIEFINCQNQGTIKGSKDSSGILSGYVTVEMQYYQSGMSIVIKAIGCGSSTEMSLCTDSTGSSDRSAFPQTKMFGIFGLQKLTDDGLYAGAKSDLPEEVQKLYEIGIQMESGSQIIDTTAGT